MRISPALAMNQTENSVVMGMAGGRMVRGDEDPSSGPYAYER